MSFSVYWCARDLAGKLAFAGNHQFILIYLDKIYGLPPLTAQEEKGQRFVTLGGFNVGGNLEFVPNETSDVKAVREHLNPNKMKWYAPDLDLEKHRITPPLASDQKFAETLVIQVQAYKVNTQIKKIKYSLSDENCSAWVNMMFKVAGVLLKTRETAGEFKGVDWGEEDYLDEKLFK